MPSSVVKNLIDKGVPSWQISKNVVFPKRITMISRGLESKKKEEESQKIMMIIETALSYWQNPIHAFQTKLFEIFLKLISIKKHLTEFERFGRALKLISRLDYINIELNLNKYRVISLTTKKQDDSIQRLGHTHLKDMIEHIEDGTSLDEVAKTINTRPPFPIEDLHNLIHHDIESIPQIIDDPTN